MDEYGLGKDIQKLLCHLERIESKLDGLLHGPDGGGGTAQRLTAQVASSSGKLELTASEWSGTFPQLQDNPILIAEHAFTVRDDGGWYVSCPTSNLSRHSRWGVTHYLSVRNRGGSTVHQYWMTWAGQFDHGYSETKTARGEHWALRQYWGELRSGEAELWSSFEASRNG